MLRTLICFGLLACFASTQASAAFVLDFTSSTEGFTASSAASVGFAGGVLQVVDAPGGGEFFEDSSRATRLDFSFASPLGVELNAAAANGGTISFDISIAESDITWAGAGRPGLLEMQLTLDSPGRDTEVELLSVPSVGGTTTRTFSANIVPGIGQQFNGTNDSINFNTSPGSLYIGLKDQGDFITTATFSIDNFTVSANAVAVPEPSSLALVAIGGVAVAARRRKSVKASV
ncbi:PEP-CTERM sorting domain-containing protein [Rubripirellula reticaptiva]|uniref:PEP-CTERM motif protein n=1 Tax=Rubripirellula reticaptiva TaxID=2528013 RepID=A0A5C6EH39_9BACT|nr:PEP-CTERM sorting domain-containing protein [Rubripirellula reticaptiva]TWU47794.1 PEP-CTERM motif protein [Rubripirellula reticaptiva]